MLGGPPSRAPVLLGANPIDLSRAAYPGRRCDSPWPKAWQSFSLSIFQRMRASVPTGRGADTAWNPLLTEESFGLRGHSRENSTSVESLVATASCCGAKILPSGWRRFSGARCVEWSSSLWTMGRPRISRRVYQGRFRQNCWSLHGSTPVALRNSALR